MSQPAHEIRYGKAARTLVMGTRGVIAAGHPLASVAGLKIMQQGGNAVDAAVAAGFVLAVVKHEACGLGGDLFSLVYMKDEGKVRALNASGPAPGNATIEAFKSRGLDAVPTSGPLSISVPGAVDGWLELHRRYGTVDLADICADAVTLARDGFPLYLALAGSIEAWAPSWPDVHRYFRAPLEDLTPGRVLRQPELAKVLESIVGNGRDGFYGGDVGARLCAGIRAQGGLFEETDLQGGFAEWMEPLSTDYRGYQLLEQPPVSQGFIVLTMMNLLAGYDYRSLSRTELAHVMVEAKKIAFEDRIRHLDDPRFGDPEVQRLIGREYADQRRGDITDSAGSVTSSYAAAGADTTYLCVADGDGNAISLIQSVFSAFGSRIVPGDTGIVMNNRLCSAMLDAGSANALQPGKRPAHTLNSYMVFHNGEFLAAGGTPGADDQPQTNVQVLHNLLDLKMDPQCALEAPRWSHVPGTPPNVGYSQALRLERGFPNEVVEGLAAKGHPVTVVEPWSFGGASLIARDPRNGTLMAAADPRRDGYALGW